jgi:hypothetical protein
MAENEQRRTRAKAWAAEIDAARRRAGFMLPAGLADRPAEQGGERSAHPARVGSRARRRAIAPPP